MMFGLLVSSVCELFLAASVAGAIAAVRATAEPHATRDLVEKFI